MSLVPRTFCRLTRIVYLCVEMRYDTTPPIYIIICAGGSGSRFGSALPKQYCDLDGRPVLMHTVDAMRRACPDAVIIVAISDDMRPLWHELCVRHRFDSPQLATGGATRWHSVYNALGAIPAQARDDSRVLIHDGARPLADGGIVDGVLRAIDQGHTGAIPATPVSDTLVSTSDGEHFGAVDRSLYRAVQTPQGFRLDALRDAYGRLGYRDTFTDDASVMAAAGYDDIVLTPGSPYNIKITNPHDIVIARLLLGL